MNLLLDPIRKIYFRYLIPALGSALVMSIYIMTDAIVIGKGVGADGLSALSIATPPIAVLMCFGLLFGVGGSVHWNVQTGLKNDKKASRFFTIALLSLTIVTLVLWACYSLFMPAIATFMGANDTLLPYVMDYMNCMTIFLPACVFSNFVAVFVRTDGEPNLAMAGVLCGGILNVILDIVFVYPCQMGMRGAALASSIGMCVQVLVISTHFLKKQNTLKLIRPHHTLQTLVQILSGGMSAAVNELANGLIVFLFNRQVLYYCGNDSLAVYSVISNCVIFFNAMFTGVGYAMQPITAMNYGAGKKERIRQVRRLAYTTVLIMGTLFTLTGLFFPITVAKIFITLTPETAAIANKAIRIYFIAFLPMSVNVLTCYYLQSVLQSTRSFLISLSRNVILSTGMILLLPLFFGGNVLWFLMILVECLTLGLSLSFLLSKKDGTE